MARRVVQAQRAACRDLDMLTPGRDEVAATLTFWNSADSLKWEPGAALPTDRIELLRRAHAQGLRTWASMEPVIDPAQSLDLIRRTAGLVDLYKLGAWNYDPRANAIDWPAYFRQATTLIEAQGAKWIAKTDLLKRAT
jgi:hypothetical protein